MNQVFIMSIDAGFDHDLMTWRTHLEEALDEIQKNKFIRYQWRVEGRMDFYIDMKEVETEIFQGLDSNQRMNIKMMFCNAVEREHSTKDVVVRIAPVKNVAGFEDGNWNVNTTGIRYMVSPRPRKKVATRKKSFLERLFG